MRRAQRVMGRKNPSSPQSFARRLKAIGYESGVTSQSTRKAQRPCPRIQGGLPFIGYTAMCRWKGYGFEAFYSGQECITRSVYLVLG